MTELERWMNDHPPLADALTAEETAALRAKVLARRPKPRVLRGWRLAAAAAALCLVAAGAVVLGLFHPMSAANETNALVQKYGEVLDEPYVDELALGECDIKFPYQVPENRYFVLGDHRATSIDSRSSVIGCVEKSQIVGKVFLRVWPLSSFSLIR